MREGKRYKDIVTEEQKKNKLNEEKEFYSLRSLVPEITGLQEDDLGYEAAYRDVQRLVKVLQLSSDIECGRLKISSKSKNEFVLLTKQFYEDSDYRDILAKLRRDEPLTDEEYYKLVEEFTKIEEMSIDEERRLGAQYLKESLELDDFYALADDIIRMVKNNIELVGEVFDPSKRMELLLMYAINIKESFDDVSKDMAQYHKLLSRSLEIMKTQNFDDLALKPDENMRVSMSQVEDLVIKMLLKNKDKK